MFHRYLAELAAGKMAVVKMHRFFHLLDCSLDVHPGKYFIEPNQVFEGEKMAIHIIKIVHS